jgi:hypothetical protein
MAEARVGERTAVLAAAELDGLWAPAHVKSLLGEAAVA